MKNECKQNPPQNVCVCVRVHTNNVHIQLINIYSDKYLWNLLFILMIELLNKHCIYVCTVWILDMVWACVYIYVIVRSANIMINLPFQIIYEEKQQRIFISVVYRQLLHHDKLIKMRCLTMEAQFYGGKISFYLLQYTYKSTCTMKCYIFYS